MQEQITYTQLQQTLLQNHYLYRNAKGINQGSFMRLNQRIAIAEKMRSGLQKAKMSLTNPVSAVIRHIVNLLVQFGLYINQECAKSFLAVWQGSKYTLTQAQAVFISYLLQFIVDLNNLNEKVYSIYRSLKHTDFNLILLMLEHLNAKTVSYQGSTRFPDILESIKKQIQLLTQIDEKQIENTGIKDQSDVQQNQYIKLAEMKESPISEQVLDQNFQVLVRNINLSRQQIITLSCGGYQKFAILQNSQKVPQFLRPVRKQYQKMQEQARIKYQQTLIQKQLQPLQRQISQNLSLLLGSFPKIIVSKTYQFANLSEQFSKISMFARQKYIKRGRARIIQKIDIYNSQLMCFHLVMRVQLSLWTLFLLNKQKQSSLAYFSKLKLLASYSFRTALQLNMALFAIGNPATARIYFYTFQMFLLNYDKQILDSSLKKNKQNALLVQGLNSQQMQDLMTNNDWFSRGFAKISRWGLNLRDCARLVSQGVKHIFSNQTQLKEAKQQIDQIQKQNMQIRGKVIQQIEKKVKEISLPIDELINRVFKLSQFQAEMLNLDTKKDLAITTLQIDTYLNKVLGVESGYLYTSSQIYDIKNQIIQKVKNMTRKQAFTQIKKSQINIIAAQPDQQVPLAQRILNVAQLQKNLGGYVEDQKRICLQRHEQILYQLGQLKQLSTKVLSTVNQKAEQNMKTLNKLVQWANVSSSKQQQKTAKLNIITSQSTQILKFLNDLGEVPNKIQQVKKIINQNIAEQIKKTNIKLKKLNKELKESFQKGKNVILEELSLNQQSLTNNLQGFFQTTQNSLAFLQNYIQQQAIKFQHQSVQQQKKLAAKMEGLVTMLTQIKGLAIGRDDSQLQNNMKNLMVSIQKGFGPQLQYFIANLNQFHIQNRQMFRTNFNNMVSQFGTVGNMILEKINQLSQTMTGSYWLNMQNYQLLVGQSNMISEVYSANTRIQNAIQELRKQILTQQTSVPNNINNIPSNEQGYKITLISFLKTLSPSVNQGHLMRMSLNDVQSMFQVQLRKNQQQNIKNIQFNQTLKDDILYFSSLLSVQLNWVDQNTLKDWKMQATETIMRNQDKMRLLQRRIKAFEDQNVQNSRNQTMNATISIQKYNDLVQKHNALVAQKKKMKTQLAQANNQLQQSRAIQNQLRRTQNQLRKSFQPTTIIQKVEVKNQQTEQQLRKLRKQKKQNTQHVQRLQRRLIQQRQENDALRKSHISQLQTSRVNLLTSSYGGGGLNSSKIQVLDAQLVNARQKNRLQMKAQQSQLQLKTMEQRNNDLKRKVIDLENENLKVTRQKNLMVQQQLRLTSKQKDDVKQVKFQLEKMKEKQGQLLKSVRQYKVKAQAAQQNIAKLQIKLKAQQRQIQQAQELMTSQREKLRRSQTQEYNIKQSRQGIQNKLAAKLQETQAQYKILIQSNAKLSKQINTAYADINIITDQVTKLVNKQQQTVAIYREALQQNKQQMIQNNQAIQTLKKIKQSNQILAEFKQAGIDIDEEKIRRMNEEIIRATQRANILRGSLKQSIKAQQKIRTISALWSLIEKQKNEGRPRDVKISSNILKVLYEQIKVEKNFRKSLEIIGQMVIQQRMKQKAQDLDEIMRKIELTQEPSNQDIKRLEIAKKQYNLAIQQFKNSQGELLQLKKICDVLVAQNDRYKDEQAEMRKTVIQPYEKDVQQLYQKRLKIIQNYGLAKRQTIEEKLLRFAFKTIEMLVQEIIRLIQVVHRFTKQWQAIKGTTKQELKPALTATIALFNQIQKILEAMIQAIFQPSNSLDISGQKMKESWSLFKKQILKVGHLHTGNKTKFIMDLFKNGQETFDIYQKLQQYQQKGQKQFSFKPRKKIIFTNQANENIRMSKNDNIRFSKSQYNYQTAGRNDVRNSQNQLQKSIRKSQSKQWVKQKSQQEIDLLESQQYVSVENDSQQLNKSRASRISSKSENKLPKRQIYTKQKLQTQAQSRLYVHVPQSKIRTSNKNELNLRLSKISQQAQRQQKKILGAKQAQLPKYPASKPGFLAGIKNFFVGNKEQDFLIESKEQKEHGQNFYKYYAN